jgi:hypothetical protein
MTRYSTVQLAHLLAEAAGFHRLATEFQQQEEEKYENNPSRLNPLEKEQQACRKESHNPPEQGIRKMGEGR